jgi:hypothetical protein
MGLAVVSGALLCPGHVHCAHRGFIGHTCTIFGAPLTHRPPGGVFRARPRVLGAPPTKIPPLGRARALAVRQAKRRPPGATFAGEKKNPGWPAGWPAVPRVGSFFAAERRPNRSNRPSGLGVAPPGHWGEGGGIFVTQFGTRPGRPSGGRGALLVACGSPPAATPAKVAHWVHTTANASDLGHFQRKTSTNAKRSPKKGAGWLGGPGDYGGALEPGRGGFHMGKLE